MDDPKVSIVIVTWNRRKQVLETIQSVYDQPYPNFEIIVVDNGSEDDSCTAILQAFPDVRLIALGRNLGPTGGRNAGFKVARGEIIFCLDSDASLDRNALEYVVQKFEQHPCLGVINSKIVNAHTGDFDKNAGWAYSEKQRIHSDEEFYTHNFSEGGCVIRKEVFEKTGLFWEKLFFGGEGEELGIRILDAGFKILYSPHSVVYHRAPVERMKPNPNRQYYNLRNSLYMYIAHYPWWMLVWFVPLKLLACSIQGIRRKNIHWVYRALKDTAEELPALWKERRPIRYDTARIYLRYQRDHGTLSWSLRSWLTNKT